MQSPLQAERHGAETRVLLEALTLIGSARGLWAPDNALQRTYFSFYFLVPHSPAFLVKTTLVLMVVGMAMATMSPLTRSFGQERTEACRKQACRKRLS
jgi:hypothetical protein